MGESLSTAELVRLVERVFRPRPEDRALAILVDLPDAAVPDAPAWVARRRMAEDWWHRLRAGGRAAGLAEVDLLLYRNARRNNGELPPEAYVHVEGELPSRAEQIVGRGLGFPELFGRYALWLAPTQLSATAPLKLAARQYGFRAATMPGFRAEMIPALRLDFAEICRRCEELKALLDRAVAAHLRFEAGGRPYELRLDLRHRTATASGGVVTEPGIAANVPSGETYIVPYEGELTGDPSLSQGELPLELEGELLGYRIAQNRIVEVLGDGPRAAAERREVAREPAYANVAELGLGVLGDYGIRPVGELLLDEKLGLHIAFGRSDHFGGHVGPAAFSAPERVVHIDRVYIPEVQPRVRVPLVELELPDSRLPLMRDGRYLSSKYLRTPTR